MSQQFKVLYKGTTDPAVPIKPGLIVRSVIDNEIYIVDGIMETDVSTNTIRLINIQTGYLSCFFLRSMKNFKILVNPKAEVSCDFEVDVLIKEESNNDV